MNARGPRANYHAGVCWVASSCPSTQPPPHSWISIWSAPVRRRRLRSCSDVQLARRSQASPSSTSSSSERSGRRPVFYNFAATYSVCVHSLFFWVWSQWCGVLRFEYPRQETLGSRRGAKLRNYARSLRAVENSDRKSVV